MTIYKSKIGYELVIPIVLILGTTFLFMAYQHIWPGAAVILVTGLFVVHVFATTFYQIDGKHVIIKSSFLVNKHIDIQAIRKISKSNNFISSPATSLDRLEILYNKFDTILISPHDKDGFIRELKMINPDIEIRVD
ncbi:MAG: PH domain-containing protein [Cyclobacteriaceae bacterium]|nr:PH domain-containing protein [Cyclobacteriaceae bacterium]